MTAVKLNKNIMKVKKRGGGDSIHLKETKSYKRFMKLSESKREKIRQEVLAEIDLYK